MHASGLSLKAIAEIVNYPRHEVQAVIESVEVFDSTRAKEIRQRDRILKFHDQGLSIPAIAKEVQCETSFVWQALREMQATPKLGAK